MKNKKKREKAGKSGIPLIIQLHTILKKRSNYYSRSITCKLYKKLLLGFLSKSSHSGQTFLSWGQFKDTDTGGQKIFCINKDLDFHNDLTIL